MRPIDPPKIVLIGAGSTSFGLGTLCDLFGAHAELHGATLALVDIDAAALERMRRVAEQLNAATGQPFTLEATTDRTAALSGARFVILAIAVERNARWRLDFELPLRHGAKQVLGENGGPGGLFHAMRNIPIILDICRDIEQLCPEALVLNFTNPEGRLCLAATRYTNLSFVGLCHGIGMAQRVVSAALDLPEEEIDPRAAGLNHFTWLLSLRHRTTGADLYPAFREALHARFDEIEARIPWGLELSRFLMDTYGLWPSPSDDHVGEYLGYAWEFCGLHGYDFDAADRGAVAQIAQVDRWGRGEDPIAPLLSRRSGERAVAIITGVLNNTHQYELAVNVPNESGGSLLIPNLPPWTIVEVPAIVDAEGVHGLPVGPLPEPVAAMCRTQAAVIDRVVEAGVHGDRTLALQALLLDPVITSRSQAEAILDDLFAVHADLLPQFRQG
jgi:alpha-galactosidase